MKKSLDDSPKWVTTENNGGGLLYFLLSPLGEREESRLELQTKHKHMETEMKTTKHASSIYGKPVVNALKRVKLFISPADTKNGKNKDPGACAAARAAMREVPNCVAARIHLGRAYLLMKDNKWRRFKTPEALRTEIVSFDRGGKFQPGEYELRPMSPSDMMPNRSKHFTSTNTNRATPGSPPTKSPRKLHVVRGVRQWGANR